MKREDLFDGITDLRDDQIAQGEEPLLRGGMRRRRLWIAAAAVLTMAVLGGVLIAPRLRDASEARLSADRRDGSDAPVVTMASIEP